MINLISKDDAYLAQYLHFINSIEFSNSAELKNLFYEMREFFEFFDTSGNDIEFYNNPLTSEFYYPGIKIYSLDRYFQVLYFSKSCKLGTGSDSRIVIPKPTTQERFYTVVNSFFNKLKQ